MSLRRTPKWTLVLVTKMLLILVLYCCSSEGHARDLFATALILQVDSPEVELPWPITDPLAPGESPGGGINLADPENITEEVVYDPITGQYVVRSTVGGGEGFNYRPPMSMSLEEYLNYDMERSMDNYWLDRVEQDSESAQRSLVPNINIKGKAFDRIFGGNTISIKPRGSAEVIFGLNISKTENPRIPVNQRRITTFNFDQRIQLNLVGNIGDKLKINTNYNTQATFDFENQVKLDYTGYEDEIIQKIEPVCELALQEPDPGSQSLFGLKAQLRFGRLLPQASSVRKRPTAKRADPRWRTDNELHIKADEYEGNKHISEPLFRGI